ncbi:hypothetical protein QBC35DRAFT_378858 [Podospora australis]|uniref:N-acetyltransferase domain-containing protein n=1 Tax=Podospora australis TaxID=1536484 RepID=A0AAN6WYQ9_9PEZI|nr:hypothetical protein QBC35DRAFT_378858 [Podospora australis]
MSQQAPGATANGWKSATDFDSPAIADQFWGAVKTAPSVNGSTAGKFQQAQNKLQQYLAAQKSPNDKTGIGFGAASSVANSGWEDSAPKAAATTSNTAQFRTSKRDPQPLTLNYWERQRIAKGIVDPSNLASDRSVLAISDTGVAESGPNNDIRKEIGPECNIRKTNDGDWHRYNWASPTGQDDDEVFITHEFVHAFVNAWMKEIPEDVKPTFLKPEVDAHWECDVDTNTGELLEPVEYPNTMFDPSSDLSADLDERRRNWTSALYIKRQRKLLKKREQLYPGRTSDYVTAESIAEQIPCTREEMQASVQQKPVVPLYNNSVPRIPCFLRPAERVDMEAVKNIYELEMKSGFQTLDSMPLTSTEWEKILGTTQTLNMPFVAAVRGNARTFGLKSGNLQWSPFNQVPVDFDDPNGHEKDNEILGFAYVSVWQPGLAGSATGSSRATTRVHVYVHPDYRKKKIGTCLLDKIMSCISPRMSSNEGYDFIDPDNSEVYQRPPRNDSIEKRPRQYFQLVASYLVRHQHVIINEQKDKALVEEYKTYDDDLVWVRHMLEDKFAFTEKVRLEAYHRSAKCREGPVVWLDEVLFEYKCEWAPRLKYDEVDY